MERSKGGFMLREVCVKIFCALERLIEEDFVKAVVLFGFCVRNSILRTDKYGCYLQFDVQSQLPCKRQLSPGRPRGFLP